MSPQVLPLAEILPHFRLKKLDRKGVNSNRLCPLQAKFTPALSFSNFLSTNFKSRENRTRFIKYTVYSKYQKSRLASNFKRKTKTYSSLARQRLRVAVDNTTRFRPNTDTALNASQRACISLIDKRNDAHDGKLPLTAAVHAVSKVRAFNKGIASYSTTTARRRKRARAVKRALRRYTHLYLLCKHREVFTSHIGTINAARGENFGSKQANFKRIYVDISLQLSLIHI